MKNEKDLTALLNCFVIPIVALKYGGIPFLILAIILI